MGIATGFTPWVIYWALVGNAPFTLAVLVALATATAAVVINLAGRSPQRTLEIGAVATFLVLTVLTSTISQSVMARWMLPLSNAGIFLVALTSVLVGKPFMREVADVGRPGDAAPGEAFARLTTLLTWVWVAVFAAMTVSSSIPPFVLGDATILDTRQPPAFLCYWVIPLTLFALGVLACRLLSDRMPVTLEDVSRNTTFVAYDEATIDELYYLAQQHADREVGAGKEAYAVKVGGMGTPLVGDDSRKSWPATYKVRTRS